MTRFRKTIAFLLILAILPFVAGVVFSKLGGRYWFFDLFTHYQQQYAMGLGALTIVALLLKQFRVALVSGLFFLIPLSALSYYYPPADLPAEPAAPALKVLSFNVLRSNANRDAVLAWLRDHDADVLLLLETDREWSRTLAPLSDAYPHQTGRLRSDAFGVSIYSKFPIENEEYYGSGRDTVPCVRVDIAWPACNVQLFAIHPVPPISARTAQNRNNYLHKFAPVIARTEGAVIAMGDFNCSPWSTHFQEFVETSGLSDSGQKRGFPSTWHRGHPIFSIPIDHILHTPHFTCTARGIGPQLGSDHRAVTATLALTDRPLRRKPTPDRRPDLQPARPPDSKRLEPKGLEPKGLQPSSLESATRPRRAPRLRRLPE